jgi:mRNA-degrading endonuclease RelE of RelBE toxin-antitoxin system
MGSFKVSLFPVAESELRAVPFPFRRQINQRLMRLKEDPFHEDSEPISDREKYRLKVHGWRVIYEVDDARRFVTVWAIAKD